MFQCSRGWGVGCKGKGGKAIAWAEIWTCSLSIHSVLFIQPNHLQTHVPQINPTAYNLFLTPSSFLHQAQFHHPTPSTECCQFNRTLFSGQSMVTFCFNTSFDTDLLLAPLRLEQCKKTSVWMRNTQSLIHHTTTFNTSFYSHTLLVSISLEQCKILKTISVKAERIHSVSWLSHHHSFQMTHLVSNISGLQRCVDCHGHDATQNADDWYNKHLQDTSYYSKQK